MKQANQKAAARRTKGTESRNQRKQENSSEDLGSIIAALRSEGDRLKQLADRLEAQEKADVEMRANYPYLKKVAYDYMWEQFQRELPPLPPDANLEKIAKEEGSVPVEVILADLAAMNEGN